MTTARCLHTFGYFSALLCVLCASALSSFAAAKPNVLLLCVDDLKPALSCYGDKLAISPNLDRLAARGMRFDLAYCNQSVCAPSRNNLLLGSRSTSLGIYGLDRNFRTAVPDAVTMTQHFQRCPRHALKTATRAARAALITPVRRPALRGSPEVVCSRKTLPSGV